jgi:hypothetical protein
MYVMISSCQNNFKKWNLRDRKYAREQFLAGEGLDTIGKNCHRHAKNVCLELIRQGVIDEKNNISVNHIRFEQESDTCSEYTPSEDESECDESEESESETNDSDYSYESDNSDESEETELSDAVSDLEFIESGSESEKFSKFNTIKTIELSDSESDIDFDAYNIEHNIENIYTMMSSIKVSLSNIVKVYKSYYLEK